MVTMMIILLRFILKWGAMFFNFNEKNIPEDKFYLDIEKCNYPIYLYDKYIQYEFIKIYNGLK